MKRGQRVLANLNGKAKEMFKNLQKECWAAFEMLEEAEKKYAADKTAENKAEMQEKEARFNDLCFDIQLEQRKQLFSALCRCLNNRGRNQFQAAADFADHVVSEELTWDSEDYELEPFYSKHGRPIVIEFK